MSPEPLTCPYCNAVQPARPDLALGQRATCARCGEAFTVTHLPEAIQGPPAAPTPGWGGAPARPAKAGWTNRMIGVGVLGVMLLMGGIGLAYALVTQDFRRRNDSSLPRKSRLRSDFPADTDPADGAPTPPARLEGLGYLPTGTNVLAGASVRDLLAHPRSGDLLKAPLAVGGAGARLDQVAEWTGLPLGEIDHALVGAVLRGGQGADLMPPTTLVFRTVRDHDREKVRKAMKATQPVSITSPDGVKRTLYSAKLGRLPVRLWQPDARTAVVGLFDDELRQVPGRPHAGASSLPAEVRGALQGRIRGAPPVWAVGHSDDWNKTLLPTLLKGLKVAGPLNGLLDQVRTVVLSATFDDGAGQLLCQAQAADAGAAEKLVRSQLAPRLQANPKAFSYSRDGAWVRLQMPIAARSDR